MANPKERELDLQALLQADRAEREQRAMEKYNQVLQILKDEDRCVIIPVITIRNGKIFTNIEIMALD